MATAAPHVKLLRQLASAKDDYLSGAFDISWDGAKATLYLVFGRPSHAVFDTDQAQIEGEAAIDALLAELPRTFAVSDWRRAMSPQETLSITIDELAGPFVRLAGSYADDPVSDENPEWWSADDSSPDLAFGLADFPLLPGGRPLWAETSPENVNLAERLAELPPSILILTGAKLRAAAVVSGGDLIDAVWIDDEDQARGEAAGMAILGATKGSLAGYALDDPRVAEALTMLWRLPLAVSGIEMAWLDPASMLAAFRADGLDRVLVIDAPVRGIALFSRGGLVAVYSETQRSAVASPERLRSLLSQARGRLTVMERKPRPVAAGSAQTAPSAFDFFAVPVPAAEPDVAVSDAPESEDDGAEAAALVSQEAPAVSDAAFAAPDAVGASDEPTPTPEAIAVSEETSATAKTTTDEERAPQTPAGSDVETPEPEAGSAPVATDGLAAPSSDEHPVATVPEGTASSETEADVDAAAPPPPPPPDAHDDPGTESAALPPVADITAEPEPKPKRAWWAFGSRKKKFKPSAEAETQNAAVEAAAAQEAEAASFSGWNVRQPNPEPQPVWFRSRDHSDGSEVAANAADAPAAEAEAEGTDAPETPAPAATWSVVEPGSTIVPEADAAPAETVDASEAPVEPTPAPSWAPRTRGESEAPVDPAAAASGSAREVATDSVGWYTPPADPGPAKPEDDQSPEASDQEPAASAGRDLASESESESESEHEPIAEAAGQVAAEEGHQPWAASDREAAPVDANDPDHEQTDSPADGGVDDFAPESPSETASISEPRAEPTHDFWAEFATPDRDAESDDVASEPEPEPDEETAPAAEHESATDTPGAPAPDEEAGHDAAHEPAATPAADQVTRKPSERTVAPWSWPLAEDESAAATAPTGSRAPAVHSNEPSSEPAPTAAHLDPGSDHPEPGSHNGDEHGFFQRDEPVGSQFVDFDEVRKELVQIGVVWLGETNAVPVTALLQKTRSTIDDFVATIDTIRGLHLEGQDPASVQAMAREMHQQAAERLCGA